MNKNYYQILDIDQSASYVDIRKKYLELALKYHPDRNRHLPIDKYIENEEYFKLITIAFTTLSDPIEREKYDKNKCSGYYYSYQNDNNSFTVSSVFLNLASKIFSEEKMQAGQDFYNTFTNFFIKTNTNPSPNTKNINEFVFNFRKFIINKNLEREKETKYNQKETTKDKETKDKETKDKETKDKETKNKETEDNKIAINKPYKKKDKDLVYNVNVSLFDIYNQVPKELNVPRLRICDMCLGRGFMGFGENMSLCHICKGIMKVIDNKVFPIDIRENQIIFKKEGNQSIIDEEPDNLVINIFSKPDDKYERLGNFDLLINYKVKLIELYSEMNIYFEHLDSKQMKIL